MIRNLGDLWAYVPGSMKVANRKIDHCKKGQEALVDGNSYTVLV